MFLAGGVQANAHSEVLDHAAQSETCQDDVRDPIRLELWPGGTGLLNHLERRACRRTATLQSLLGQLQEEGFSSGNPSFSPILADGHHSPEDVIVGDRPMSTARTASRVSAAPFLKLCGSRRLATSDDLARHPPLPS